MPQISLPQLVQTIAVRPVLVCFPTDTVPALATQPDQAALIYAAKRRPPEKPLILMGASLDDLLPYIAGGDAERQVWRTVAEQHWPGQLTLVLPASTPLAGTPLTSTLNPLNTGTLGIRVPNHPVALDLLTRTGPLATTSANLSGQPPLTAIAKIMKTFPTVLTLPDEAFTTAKTASGTPSTVAMWTDQGIGDSGDSPWEILRQGEICL